MEGMQSTTNGHQGDTSASRYLTDAFPSPEQIREDIERDGFQVYHGAIDTAAYGDIRTHWLNYFTGNPKYSNFVRGGLFLGEESFNSYSRCHHWDLFRYFDFLWNEPAHALSRDICLEIHKRRNRAQGFDERYGLDYNSRRYGVYISVSYYPPNGGFFHAHEDGHSDIPLLHFMLPITFQGKDYVKGGLCCYTKDGERVDVDEQMEPGSIVFFDGRQKHGVEPIVSNDEMPLGRLAVFAIPTIFENGSKSSRLFRDTKNSLYFACEGLAVKARDKLRSMSGKA